MVLVAIAPYKCLVTLGRHGRMNGSVYKFDRLLWLRLYHRIFAKSFIDV